MTADWCAFFQKIIKIKGPNHPALLDRIIPQAINRWPREREHILTGALLAAALSAGASLTTAVKAVIERQEVIDQRITRLENRECSREAS